MKNLTKTLMVCLVLALVLIMVRSTAMAQYFLGFPPLWQNPAFSQQPMQVPTISQTTGDILIDNFQYWDSPYNHGWQQIEPAYPVYGYGLGYATIFNTVLDLQQGSRVLDVYRPASVFLLGTPYQKHQILYQLPGIPLKNTLVDEDGNIYTDEDDVPDDVDTTEVVGNGIVSFDFRAPLGIEPWDIFEMVVLTVGTDPNNWCGDEDPDEDAARRTINFVLTPTEPPAGACTGPLNTTEGMYGVASAVQSWNEDQGQLTIRVVLGRGLLDGSWHAVWVDLVAAADAAIDAYNLAVDAEDEIPYPTAAEREEDPYCHTSWDPEVATGVLVSGQMFRLDNLAFRRNPGYSRFLGPDLFEMGPLYAQLFEPYIYLFVADYDVGPGGEDVYDADFLLDPNTFLICEQDDPDGPFDPNDPYVKAWVELGADPNLFNDPNGDPALEDVFGRDFTVFSSLPIFKDPELRMKEDLPDNPGEYVPGDRLATLLSQGTLGWNLTVNSYGANAVQTVGALNPLFINPFDGIPSYMPAMYDAIELAIATGKPFYGPGFAFILEGAMFNSGVPFWPNMATLNFTPYYFEDLILTIEVTNGGRSDVRTFPLSVVNYPVENYPPVLQLNVEDQIFYVGEQGLYLMNFIDPDCFIFSTSGQPATTHAPGMRNDMNGLFWTTTLNGLPSYQYGPWIEQIVAPASGLISFVPKFEGAYDVITTCTDARGAAAFGEVTIFAVNRGTWLNHPPIVLSRPTQPVVIKAGEEFIMPSPDIKVEDPDGDALYASCNIGTCGRAQDGAFIWKFQSDFPGSYVVEIIFYDIRGGYAIVEFFLDVKPWWSY
jgi:hypothetical protein